MFVTEQVNKGKKAKKDKSKQSISQSYNEEDGNGVDEAESLGSIKSSSVLSKKSIEYGEFHKVAAELLGNEK